MTTVRSDGPVFRILGPVGVGASDSLRSGQQRALLAALVLSGNRTVANDRLIQVLHGDEPPPTAAHGLHVRVSQLRRTLQAALGGADDRLVLSPPGYRLRLQPGELDWDVFRALADRGRQALAAGRLAEASETLGAALALWRGAPFADVASPALDDQRAHLEQRRLAAVEDRFEAGLRAGRHLELAAELAEALDAQPLRERLRGQLMLALYRGGRVTEALAAYRDGRHRLNEEFGLEPGEELRRLEAAILRADPALDLPAPVTPVVAAPPAPVTPPAGVVPAQLPADVEHFTGRSTDLARLDAWLRSRSGGSSAMVLTAIAGTAGVGKTALAVHWAQRVKAEFPDGQLYVDLRGYDPDQPVTAGDALALFLRELGVDDVPLDVQQRAARYRSLLAGRRMLVLLDNASSVEQVRPLLPGTGSCAVLVTSRDDLAGLVARHGAQRVTLDLLPPEDALRLLAVLVGERVADEPVAAAELVRRCARLPLAVRIAAERAAARPDLSITDLLAELADETERLDALGAGGDERTAVRAVFSWSYRHLEEPDARAFRLLGLHPGRDADPWALSAMTGGTVREAAERIDRLARAHLVRRSGERCSMHDLLRAYASEQAAAEGEADLALRLLEYYAVGAEHAAALLHPDIEARRPGADPVVLPELADADAARRWLDAERANLVSVAEVAERRRPEVAMRLATATWRYLDTGGRGVEALAIHGHAVAAARRAGDPAAEGRALTYLGVTYWRAGRFSDAVRHYLDGLARLDEAGDELMAARTRMNLGMLREAQGHSQEAGELFEAALAVFRAYGYRVGHVDALRNLGDLDVSMGRLGPAVERYSEALRICASLDDPMREGMARHNLSETLNQLGRFDEALEQLLSALELFRRSGFRGGEAHALHNLADIYLQLGRPGQAAGFCTEALAVFRETGYAAGELDALLTLAAVRQAEADLPEALELYRQALRKVQDAGMVMLQIRAHNGLAEALAACTAHDEAAGHFERALELSVEVDQRVQEARAHDGLAAVRFEQSRTDEARDHWLAALAIYRESGVPGAEAVEERLRGLGAASAPR